MAATPTLRQRVLDYIGTGQRSRDELLAAFPGQAVMTAVHGSMGDELIRNLKPFTRSGGLYARAHHNNSGADLAQAWFAAKPEPCPDCKAPQEKC